MAHPFKLQAAADGEYWLVATAAVSTLLLRRRHAIKGCALSIGSIYGLYKSRQFALEQAQELVNRKVDQWNVGDHDALLDDIQFIARAGDLVIPAVNDETGPPTKASIEKDEGRKQARDMALIALAVAAIAIQLMVIRSTYFKSISPLGEM